MNQPNTQDPFFLALTMGDPAGVGPEIIAHAWPLFFDRGRFPCFCPVVYGSGEVMARAGKMYHPDLTVETLPADDSLSAEQYAHRFGPKVMACREVCSPDGALAVPGTVDRRGGEAAFSALNAAIDAALAGRAAAIVTAPLNKESLNLAGHHFPGHTEILAHRCGVDDFAMMLYLGPDENLAGRDGLSVVHVTLHTAMKNVFEQITEKTVEEKIFLIRDFMRIMKHGADPAIGVCALNCHNGENGLFGREEIDVIAPAVARARAKGVNVSGPFPSDTLFLAAKEGAYDSIVAMIHDQGHIAVKLLGMHKAVNITLGLPIIRTSVAHGTAFDKVGKGTAKITSLLEAVRAALLLADARRAAPLKTK